MKIVHFAGTMRVDQDGVTRVLYRLREESRHSSHSYRFITSSLPDEIQNDIQGVRSIPFPLNTEYRLAMTTPGSVSKILAADPPDLVHLHSPCTLGNAAIGYAQKRGIPVVATYHTHFPTYLKYYHLNLFQRAGWKYIRSFYNRCDQVIVPSRFTLQELEAQKIRNLVFIPHGVDTQRFSPEYRSEGWRRSVGSENKMMVTFVGRLVWEKNLMILAKAYAELASDPRFKFVVVGDGPARSDLQDLMPNASFIGFQSGTDLARAYASSDIFVMPSVTETFGNVTVEAMASGCAVICAAAGGAVDIVSHNEDGLLTRPNDVTELTQSILALAQFPDRRQQLAKNAIAKSGQFQWSKVFAQHESLYERLIAENKEQKSHSRGTA